jgi:hypothetical protein
MANYKSSTDPAKGQPNLEALQYLQDNWGKTEIAAAIRIEKVTVTASGTSGVAASGIPQGAEIIDAWCVATSTVGSGSAQVKVTDGDAITDAMDMATADALARATTIDTTYSTVGADGIEVVTNGDTDAGYVYIAYTK